MWHRVCHLCCSNEKTHYVTFYVSFPCDKCLYIRNPQSSTSCHGQTSCLEPMLICMRHFITIYGLWVLSDSLKLKIVYIMCQICPWVIAKDPEWLTYLSCLFSQNLFKVESVNCICVDWKGGSQASYPQASLNIQIVGAEVAYFVKVLQVSTSRLWQIPHHCFWGLFPKGCCKSDHW